MSGGTTWGSWAGMNGKPEPRPDSTSNSSRRTLGEFMAADTQEPAPAPLRFPVDPTPPDPRLALNPLLDDLRRTQPQLADGALYVGGVAPTLFATGDLPPFTASGLDVGLLRKVAWRARPALAVMDSSVAVTAFNLWAVDVESAMSWQHPYGRNAAFKVPADVLAKAEDILASYEQRFREWRQAGYAGWDYDAGYQSTFMQAQPNGSITHSKKP